MYNYPSRTEKREARFYSKAEKGILYSEEILYISEVKKLRKQGFCVTEIKDFECSHNNRHLITSKVSWNYAYGTSIPYIVHEYVNGNIETFPRGMIENLSQELYVIARRAMHKNSK